MQDNGFIYKPENLIKVKDSMLAQKEEQNSDEAKTKRGYDLLRRLSQTDNIMISATALALSKEDVFLASENLYQITPDMDSKKILEVLRCRTTPEVCINLYNIWQENYTEPALKNFIKSLAESDQSFRKTLKKYRIKEHTFCRLLDSNCIPLSFIEEIMKSGVDVSGVAERLATFGIKEGTKLDIECKQTLLAICEKADYLNCSDDNIIDVVQNYDAIVFNRFLHNFLGKLSLNELEPYIKLASYLAGRIGRFSSDSFKKTFDGFEQPIKQKYMDWINISKLKFWFRGDDKSRFWKAYRFDNVARHESSGVVAMGMGHYVALELYGTDKGITYICDREVFKHDIHKHLDSMTQEEIKSYFSANKSMFIEKRSHYPRWQAHIKNILMKKEIGVLI